MDTSDMRSKGPDLVELATKYAGRWVALDRDGSVIASGGSAREVVEAAETGGVELPLILRVSDDYGQLAPCHL
jgi:hypothetical protein